MASAKKRRRSKKVGQRQRRANRAADRKFTRKHGYSKQYNLRKQAAAKATKAATAKSAPYLTTAKAYAPYVPKLKKLAKKKSLTGPEKTQIKKYEKALANVTDLYPVSATYAKRHPNELFRGIDDGVSGINAVRLRNIGAHKYSKVTINDDDIIITSNGRTWVYWRLDKNTVRNKDGKLGDKAKDAFHKAFPIEIVSAMAEEAFKSKKVLGISLWTPAGRADYVARTLKRFLDYVNEKWQAGRYVRTNNDGEVFDSTDPGAWINGIAVWIDTTEVKKKSNEVKAVTAKRKVRKRKASKKPAKKRISKSASSRATAKRTTKKRTTKNAKGKKNRRH